MSSNDSTRRLAEAIRQAMERPRLFFSFDFDQDRRAATLVAGQMKNHRLGFWIEDWSLKEASPQRTWHADAEKKIRRSDLLVVVVGRQTYRAPGVKVEIAIAKRRGVPVASIIASNAMQPVQEVPGAGPVYVWGHGTLDYFMQIAMEHRRVRRVFAA